MSAIVVGGGYAGIAAALALADRGEAVTLLEARRHWGGRATSWPDPKMNDEVDNGQHVWMGCYERTLALLERLGTRDLVAFGDGLDLHYRDSARRAHRLQAPAVLGRAGLALGLLGFGAMPLGDRVSLGRAIASAPAPLAHETVAAWLDRLGQAGPARRAFWSPLTEAAINLPIEEASARLLYEVLVRAFRGRASAAAVGVPRAGLGRLVAPIEDRLAARGGRARLGAAVRSVARGFRVTLESGETLEADRVVLAAPADAARALLAAIPEASARLEDAARVPSSPIVTVTLWFDPAARVPPLAGLLDPAEGFHWAFDRGAFVPSRGDARPVVLVASAARALIPLQTAEIVRRARATLAKHGLVDAEPVATRVVKEPHATPAFTPAHANARPPADSGVPGLAFAGDWTATGLPATIEGAVVSGLRASDILCHPPVPEVHA